MIALGIIAVLIVLVTVTRVGIIAQWDGALSLQLAVGPIRFKLTPGKKKTGDKPKREKTTKSNKKKKTTNPWPHVLLTNWQELLELVLSLPEKYRIVLYLYFFIGYSLAEISELIKVNQSTVRSRLFYGKKKLRKMIGGNEYEKIYGNDETYPPNRGTEEQNA